VTGASAEEQQNERPEGHTTPIRVRFDEVDTMGIVHHPRYLVYFEIARTAFLRDIGLPYKRLIDSGTHLTVLEAGARYLKPAVYDDVLDIVTRCTECTRVRLTLEYEVRRGAEVLATGLSRHAAVDDDGRPKRLPTEVREGLQNASSGE
jgi:acyl-CoA thioester hydrolase